MRLGIRSSLFPSGFVTKTLYGFLVSLVPARRILLGFITVLLIPGTDPSGRAVKGVSFGCLDIVIVRLNTAQGMDVCPRLSVLCCQV
jgi:hypothetical protein